MIERQLLGQKLKEFMVQEFITKNLTRAGHSHTKIQKTPLGDKIIIYASRPGLVVGSKGQNIKRLTSQLKKNFDLENPQIEINEVENIYLDATIVAEIIVAALERFGSQRFKGVGHKTLSDVMNAGALGVEILISGKVPSSRAKTWRFYAGYLKKCGDISETGVKKAILSAKLKSGIIGVKVRIMPPDTKRPDDIEVFTERKEAAVVEEKVDEKKKPKKKRKKTAKKKPNTEKKPADVKKEEKKSEPKKEEKKEVTQKPNVLGTANTEPKPAATQKSEMQGNSDSQHTEKQSFSSVSGAADAEKKEEAKE